MDVIVLNINEKKMFWVLKFVQQEEMEWSSHEILFGSIQIFTYVMSHKVNLDPKIGVEKHLNINKT